MPIAMDAVGPGEARRILDRYGADRVLLVGPPGVGKSTVVRSYAEDSASREGLEFVDLSEARSLEDLDTDSTYAFLHIYAPLVRAEDLAFIARRGEGYDWTLPSRLAYLTRPGVRGLVFIDEITNVALPEVQTILFSMVLDKRVAYNRLSSGVEVVAAGNSPRDSPVSQWPPPPLLDRFRLLIRVKPPDLEEWVSWMNSVGRPWDRRVAAVLKVKPVLMYRPPEDEEDKFPTPRSWSQLAWELAKTGAHGDEAVRIAAMVVGRRAAEEARQFLQPDPASLDLSTFPRLDERERLTLLSVEAGRLASQDVVELCRTLEKVGSYGAHYAVWLLMLSGVDTVEAARSCSYVEDLLSRLSSYLG
ncbi:ATP-binding protein [Aeropyrum pernix]|nr:MoxR family ATPase [Aeropyrum pernix]